MQINGAQHCWLLLVILVVATRCHGQLDSHGFLSIDCGFSGASSYLERLNNLVYVSDDNFIDTGLSSNISSSYISNNQFKEYQTVRYFPNGTRNCYIIKPLTAGLNYLIRATFYYANYDGLNKPPSFDIYLGVTHWSTVNAASDILFEEMIFTATADFVHLCLLNKGQGVPFISSIHLRQFSKTMYPYANSSASLILQGRYNLGGSDLVTWYPDDIYDRWWFNDTLSNSNTWKYISTSSKLDLSDPDFEVPSVVMQTAATTSSVLQPLSFGWSSDKSAKYYFILYFYEIQTTSIGRREFNMFVNGDKVFDTPRILSKTGDWRWISYWDLDNTYYNVSLVATPNSTLPPLLNAFELYTVVIVGISTYAKDVSAINSVKEYHKIKKGWSGDPCFPAQFTWSGVSCNADSSKLERITSLNLSSSDLNGSLSDSIGNLTALQYLYLSNNSLSGTLPKSLDSLTSLKLLDIRGNPQLSTVLPPELESKLQSKFLEYRYGDILSPSSSSQKKNVTVIAVAVVVPLLVIAAVVAIVLALKRRNYRLSIGLSRDENRPSNYHINDANIPQAENPTEKPHYKGAEQIIPQFDNRRFSYTDLKKITNDFKNNIGTGGYGKVYLGNLANGVQVAVKMLSESSHQGAKEFLAEAENLSRVHHRNLVALMGYCTDQSCMALVYEYMQEGNLHDKLKDKAAPLSWRQRLHIAYESAQGLEYLHKSCNPPLIHRDVKTSNILLNANLEAKIADFGLSRAFDNDLSSHVSTRIVGTVGYLDPEYYLSNQLSAKSDVFSFGVVLLEIITGRAPTGAGIEGGNLVQWVRRQLSGGEIETIVDPKIQDKYDINSVWKVAELACKCTEPSSSKRPTMSAVVTELKESLDLEATMEEVHIERTDNLLTDVSQTSNIEMAYTGDVPLMGPRVR